MWGIEWIGRFWRSSVCYLWPGGNIYCFSKNYNNLRMKKSFFGFLQLQSKIYFLFFRLFLKYVDALHFLFDEIFISRCNTWESSKIHKGNAIFSFNYISSLTKVHHDYISKLMILGQIYASTFHIIIMNIFPIKVRVNMNGKSWPWWNLEWHSFTHEYQNINIIKLKILQKILVAILISLLG